MISILAALVFATQTPAATQSPADAVLVPPAATTPPTPTPEEENRLNEQVCRTEAVVGTRFGGRICMTRREWNQRRDDSRRLAQRIETGNSRRNSPPLANTAGR